MMGIAKSSNNISEDPDTNFYWAPWEKAGTETFAGGAGNNH